MLEESKSEQKFLHKNLTVQKELNWGAQGKVLVVTEQGDTTPKILKIYTRGGRTAFRTEKAVLIKVHENNLSGFPKLYSAQSDPKQNELLMSCLGKNFKEAESEEPGGSFES